MLRKVSKDLLRAELLEKRAAIDPADHKVRSLEIIQNFLQSIPFQDHSCIGLYDAIRHEVSVGPLVVELADRGHATALPTIETKNAPLLYKHYELGDALVDGPFGTREPVGLVTAPSLLILPMVGFTRDGYRLGYGGGYYDRTLEELRRQAAVVAVGLAFHEQERQDMNVDPHDERLDYIVTDREVLAFD
ncbi:MAG: 5-formyltetrahydrofolate cyclo-ligase [Alphaproteobacteria bacterium]|nr:MAG: 5-formyltetrahydrofolate cyclo-ligase [Alphaproteobacteria bacterium]